MGSKSDAEDVALSVVAAQIAAEIPVFGALVRVLEKWTVDARVGRMEADVQKILEIIGPDDRALDERIQEALNAAVRLNVGDGIQIRKAESCLAIARYLNTRSELGWEWDPSLDREQALGIIRSHLGGGDPVSELRAVVAELKRVDLILVMDNCNAPEELPWEIIGPEESFFCRTDSIFQSWNPEEDAREICRRSKAERVFQVTLLDDLGWTPRRINSAAMFAKRRGWLNVPYEFVSSTAYVIPWANLSEEGEFFSET
jgi:hypothetical protein